MSRRRSWLLAWRVSVPAWGGGTRLVTMRCALPDAAAVRVRARAEADGAWAGEFRVSAPGGRELYVHAAALAAWRLPEETLPRTGNTVWGGEARRETAVLAFVSAVRAAASRAVDAGVIKQGGAGRLVALADELAGRPDA